jgi:demethylmenaquinone methyltransferase/2-methoxy-6-polyprenyl-1,4-benzoquinol methylase
MLEVEKKIATKNFLKQSKWFCRFRKHAFKDDYFDAITVAFGVRNFETLEKD